jgi:hypothetical protein
MVLTATHNFSLHGEAPVLNTRIQMHDIAQATHALPVKQEETPVIISDKATAE